MGHIMWLLEASIRNAERIMFDNWNLKRAGSWKLKFCWLPKKCAISEKKLWGQFAYQGYNVFFGPGDPVVEYYWIERTEFLIWNLKGRK
jgi:hypothetical protein